MSEKKQNRWRRLLRKAANILKKSSWCKGTLARDKNGAYVENPLNPTAESFCLVGSLIKAYGKDPFSRYGGYPEMDGPYSIALNKLRGTFDTSLPIWKFNDTAQSKEEVINFMLKVANE